MIKLVLTFVWLDVVFVDGRAIEGVQMALFLDYFKTKMEVDWLTPLN
jgi:hypothetical protein